MEPENAATPKRALTEEERLCYVREVYERGHTIDALRRAEEFAPLAEWRGVEPSVLAARIAANAGAPRLSTRLSFRAWKTDPEHPDAQSQYAYELISRRGAFMLWRKLRTWPENPRANAEQQAESLVIQAWAHSDLRDFTRAEELLSRAEKLDPGRPWIQVQRARVLEAQDRVEEALETCRAGCALHPHPFYRVGVQTQAHLLQSLDRDEDAIQLLRDADGYLQNGPVVAQLYSLLSENDRWTEAEAALTRYEELSPLLEPPLRKWLQAQRARVAYHLGRRTDAAKLASQLDDEFHKRFAERLIAEPPTRERVELDVTFVRQHFKTCAPATLAAIGRYWRMPAEHLKLAEAMCYDGTPGWQQRDWAERNGWHVRTFRVTQEVAVELIERGMPFAISVVEATSAHMMAVIGFDRARGTLLLRDPGQPYVGETAAEEFLKRFSAFGPEGMLFVPIAEKSRLDGVVLPDAEQHDELHRISMALMKHDRVAAEVVVERMACAFPDAPLTCEARLQLAGYDGNSAELVRWFDRLLELFPGNPARQLRRFGCMQDASREERIQWLEKLCGDKGTDPAVLIALARALQGDARHHAEAARRLKRAMRFRAMDTSAMGALADLCWSEGKLGEATEIYRCAANLEGYRDDLYRTWFAACHRTRRWEEAITHLQSRFARFGAKSEQPALTLAWAWRELDQPVRAREVLEEAMRLRPDDAFLRLRAASLLASLEDVGRAQALMAEVRGKVRHNDWLRTSAEIAENQLDYDGVLKAARELLEREPLAMDAHGGVARALARREGMTAALAGLKKAGAAFPHHFGLQRMIVEWSREEGPESVAAAARELLRREPADAWAHRELALALGRSGKRDEALRAAEEAARIEPRNSYCHSVLGHLCRDAGQPASARKHFRQAVAHSVDNGDAIEALLQLARTDDERKEELAFVERELIRQVVTGDGLLSFQDIARPILDPAVLLEKLQHAHRERPDLWHAWSALVVQFGHMGRLDEALATATEASRRFSHLPRIWLDLSAVHKWRKEPDAEIAAAQRAFEINPSWNHAAISLAGAHERQGRLEDARLVYERALRHAPMDARLHASHANLLWRLQRNGDCFTAIEQALRLAPGFDWAWGLLTDWAAHLNEEHRVSRFARELSHQRPGDIIVWLALARALSKPEELPERMQAVERALALDGRSTEAWDLKAELHVAAEQFDAAIEACHAGIQACATDVFMLQGRHAWVEASRRRFPEAIRLMREVLKANVSYVWGWHQLGSWLIEQNQLPEATAAFERLQALRPHDAWVSRQLGFLRLKLKDNKGANEAFAAALAAAPTDVAAAHNLFNAQLDASDLDGAAATLRVMQMHQPSAATQAAELSLRLHQGDKPAALKCYEAIAQSPEPESWALNNATDVMKRRAHAKEALKILKPLAKAGNGNPQCAAAAVPLFVSLGCYTALTWFFMSLPAGEQRRRAAIAVVRALAEQKRRWHFAWLLWRRRDAMSSDIESWGQVGYALTTFNQMKKAAAWLADWERRPNVQPWMLFNHCLALRNIGRFDEATRVARHVVNTWGHREGASELRLFLAVEEAIKGDVAAAQTELDQVSARSDNAYDQQLLALARALVAFHKAPVNERRMAFQSVHADLVKYFGAVSVPHLSPDIRRTFARAGKAFRRGGAGWKARWWFAKRKIGVA